MRRGLTRFVLLWHLTMSRLWEGRKYTARVMLASSSFLASSAIGDRACELRNAATSASASHGDYRIFLILRLSIRRMAEDVAPSHCLHLGSVRQGLSEPVKPHFASPISDHGDDQRTMIVAGNISGKASSP